jgi:hypothetical protein
MLQQQQQDALERQDHQQPPQQQQEQQVPARQGSRVGAAGAGAASAERPSPLLLASDALDHMDPTVSEAGTKKVQARDSTSALLERRSNASMDRWKQVRLSVLHSTSFKQCISVVCSVLSRHDLCALSGMS